MNIFRTRAPCDLADGPAEGRRAAYSAAIERRRKIALQAEGMTSPKLSCLPSCLRRKLFDRLSNPDCDVGQELHHVGEGIFHPAEVQQASS
jgi:hypothetical protein